MPTGASSSTAGSSFPDDFVNPVSSVFARFLLEREREREVGDLGEKLDINDIFAWTLAVNQETQGFVGRLKYFLFFLFHSTLVVLLADRSNLFFEFSVANERAKDSTLIDLFSAKNFVERGFCILGL